MQITLSRRAFALELRLSFGHQRRCPVRHVMCTQHPSVAFISRQAVAISPPYKLPLALPERFCRWQLYPQMFYPVCTGLTVPGVGKVPSSIMTNKNSDKEAEIATLRAIKEQMAKPRIAKSARTAKPEDPPVFPLSGSAWPGSASPSRRHHRLATHPGAS